MFKKHPVTQKIFLVVFLILQTSFLFAKELDCAFSGTINGQQTKSFQCSIDRAGTVPYILLGVAYGKNNLMIDLNGITNKTGSKNFTIKIMELEGKNISKTYRGEATQNVQTDPKRNDVMGFVGGFNAKDSQGNTLNIQGIFVWKIDIFPKEENITGSFETVFGQIKVQSNPGTVKISPWHKGYKIDNLFLVKAGETLTVSFEFLSLNPGVYNNIKTSVMHMSANKNDVISDFYSEDNVTLKIEKIKDKLVLKFNGTVKSKTQKLPLSAVWTEQ